MKPISFIQGLRNHDAIGRSGNRRPYDMLRGLGSFPYTSTSGRSSKAEAPPYAPVGSYRVFHRPNRSPPGPLIFLRGEVLMFDGLEIDMLSLGDADCIVVTSWTPQLGCQRVLIDGGNEGNFPVVKDFLRSLGMTTFWAVVCTHLHKDHASGLIKIVQDPTFTIHNAWMHDIGRHISEEALWRASRGTSSQADGVKQVWETTKELANAFSSRGLLPSEPFAGDLLAGAPPLQVLGPTRDFYRRAIQEFTSEAVPNLSSLYLSALETSPLAGPSTSLANLMLGLGNPRPAFPAVIAPPVPLAGLLKESSVKTNPTTQPFNNTSTIMGIILNNQRFLFTADAGSEALDSIPSDWRSVLWMQVPHHGSDGNLSQANIERFCPKVAFISARGSTDHPSRAIVNGLIKAGATVCSTHKSDPGHFWFWVGSVPARSGYGPVVALKGTSNRLPPSLALPHLPFPFPAR